MTPDIELLKISAQRSGKRKLHNINLSLAPGNHIGLIGPNGSGKSTLLHLILGLIPATEGDIKIFGQPMTCEKDFVKARRQVGLLFQNADDQLFCPTVIDDVVFGPLNLGKTRDEARAIAERTLARLAMEGMEDKITSKLSGGEKKLVSFASVLAMGPRVLLLDEPTTGLDEETKELFAQVLNELAISAIVVSHDYDFLIKTTSRIYGMENQGIIDGGETAIMHQHFHHHDLGDMPHNHSTS